MLAGPWNAQHPALVSVAGVGFDIGCGNCALRTTTLAEALDFDELADAIASTFSFGIGRTEPGGPKIDHLLHAPAWDAVPKRHRAGLKDKADAQAGTIGSGNHYIDVFEDDEGFVWVGVHFGSRGFGHSVASGFMALGKGQEWNMRGAETETLLPTSSELGAGYWALMELAGEYAFRCREWVARKTVGLFGGTVDDVVHNNHNFAWKERHVVDGEERTVVVVRKGATPAFGGQRGFVGGSMGDNAVILAGVVSDDPAIVGRQQEALYSTVHGAGRVMSRSRAKKEVTPDEMRDWVIRQGVIVRGGGLDESPQAYRRLQSVLFAHEGTIAIEHVLMPRVVVMAGADVRDPYKD